MNTTIAMSTVPASLDALMHIEGARAVALVDSDTGMLLGGLGGLGGSFDLEVAAAGNTELLRAKARTARALGLPDAIDDVLITMTSQFHVLMPLRHAPEVFLYLVLDRDRANLAMARLKTREVEKQLVL